MQTLTYAISTRYWTIHDEPRRDSNLHFHLQSGDYFAMLATLLGALGDALRDNIARHESPSLRHIDMLEKLRSDLNFLQRNYRIESRHMRAD
jgi:hypothetical protein